jgi:hypothetical protein
MIAARPPEADHPPFVVTGFNPSLATVIIPRQSLVPPRGAGLLAVFDSPATSRECGCRARNDDAILGFPQQKPDPAW